MKTIIALSVPAVLLAGAAMAGSPAPAVIEPVVEPVAPVAVITPMTPDWTGFYVGAQASYGDYDLGGDADGSVKGASYGLHAGYNYDFQNNWVVGADLSYDWSNADGEGVDLDNLTTLKLKGGYAYGGSLIYATAGWSWADASWSGNDYSDNGWVAGVGVDYMLNPNWIVGAEVLYRDFSDFDDTGVDLSGTSLQVKASYKF